MIQAKQRNTTIQELQSKIQQQFQVYQHFQSRAKPKTVAIPNVRHSMDRRFEVSPERRTKQLLLKGGYNHRSKGNQSEIVRGFSRPNSSNNSQ